MYKVFLVEDEIVVREGLRDIIPWQQYGFSYVGDAPDGEAALPRIRQLRPNVLITDIRMPFMDGLALSRIVHAEFPKMKILIASGYDDFEYARAAIEVGVEQYLLKPITKATMLDVLNQLRAKLDAEQEQADYYQKFLREAQEYEQFSRRRFFENLVSGRLAVQEIYESAAKLGLDITASQYNILQFAIQQEDNSDQYFEPTAELQAELGQLLVCCPEYLLFRWNLTTFAVLIKGEPDTIAALTARCAESICRRCENAEAGVEWHVASGVPVGRLSALPGCFAAVSRLLSYRYLYPKQHVLTPDIARPLTAREDEERLNQLDAAALDSSRILNFLKAAQPEEVEPFVSEYCGSLGENALDSLLFCQYLMLHVRFTATAFVETLPDAREEFLAAISGENVIRQAGSGEQAKAYISHLLSKAIALRDRSAADRYHALMDQTKQYIEQHYTHEDLSLNGVAKAVNLSASYFSALFSQEMGKTFTEYVTEKRMEKARELLRTSALRSSEVAFAVGFKDSHYFSYLFKKTQGCTPRDYRASAGGKP
ncbi:MAG: response regulator [Faecalibacterium sp.]|nr:response regulator [Faecalibacterium sp.]